MTVKVGYIEKWRRAIFFTLIFGIAIFGLTNTLCNAYVGIQLATNVISVAVLLACIVFFVLVLADKWDRYTGDGTAVIEDGYFVYNDKKRHIKVKLSDIKKVDMEKITMGGMNEKVLAYKMLIKTDKKKYYIESDRADGRAYDQVDLHRLYIFLQKNLK